MVPLLIKPDAHHRSPMDSASDSSSSRKRKSSAVSDEDRGGPSMKMNDEQKRQQWIQNPTDTLKLSISSTPSATAPAYGPGLPSSTSMSPMSNHTTTPTPPDALSASRQGSSPMNVLMNAGESITSPVGPPPPSGMLQHSSLMMRGSARHSSPAGRRGHSGSGPVSDTGVGSTMPESTSGAASQGSPELLRCTICQERLEDTHFVQCPSVTDHKFCFPCSKESIKRQGAGTEVYCPSGNKCPLAGSNVPWAFMQGEIVTILGEDYPRQGTPRNNNNGSTDTGNSVGGCGGGIPGSGIGPNIAAKDMNIKKERDT